MIPRRPPGPGNFERHGRLPSPPRVTAACFSDNRRPFKIAAVKPSKWHQSDGRALQLGPGEAEAGRTARVEQLCQHPQVGERDSAEDCQQRVGRFEHEVHLVPSRAARNAAPRIMYVTALCGQIFCVGCGLHRRRAHAARFFQREYARLSLQT